VEVRAFDHIAELTLAGPKYTDDVIGPLTQMSYLKTLTLRNTKITDAGVEQIRRALPEVEVIR